MNRIIGVVLAAAFASASVSIFAAELTDQDRTELRQRAQALQNERSRNPDFQPGQGRAAPQPADATARPAARAGKSKRVATGQKETRREKVARKARSIKKLPGAFVRK